MNRRLDICTTVLAAGVLAGCAGSNWQGSTPLYRCEHAIEFRVRFIDDTAVLDGTRGYDVLNRDAGGQGPQQTVYSNPRMRAEFGLGANGREAVLSYPMLPLSARCVRD
jgi:hypothetical protein